MELDQKEIQMELDLRGSEASMTDSLGIKDAAIKGKQQRPDSNEQGT